MKNLLVPDNPPLSPVVLPSMIALRRETIAVSVLAALLTGRSLDSIEPQRAAIVAVGAADALIRELDRDKGKHP